MSVSENNSIEGLRTEDNYLPLNITDAMNNEPYTSLREEVHELLHNKEPVHFNNGFIYKHGNTFICNYGGLYDGMFGTGSIQWTHRNLRDIKRLVHILAAKHSYPEIVYTEFERSVKGTQKLYKFLRNNMVDERSYRKYMIGVLLYHQLLYTPKLLATFDEGEPPSYFKVMAKLGAERNYGIESAKN